MTARRGLSTRSDGIRTSFGYKQAIYIGDRYRVTDRVLPYPHSLSFFINMSSPFNVSSNRQIGGVIHPRKPSWWDTGVGLGIPFPLVRLERAEPSQESSFKIDKGFGEHSI